MEDDDLVVLVVDPVKDPERPAPSGPESRQLLSQGFPNPSWVLDERSRDQIDDGRRDRLG